MININEKSYTWIFLVAMLCYKNPIYAACLGLSKPEPKTTNVCEILLEKLVIPKTKVFCDISFFERFYAPPHCNVPGICITDPICKSFTVTREIGNLIINAGDLYCDTREILPNKIIEGIRDELYTDVVKLTTGGTSSILFDIANRDIDIMSCSGEKLNTLLKERIKCLLSKSTDPNNKSFSLIDIDRVIIISERHKNAKIYLKPGYSAITLNDLVILRDKHFKILNNWNKKVGEPLTKDEKAAILIMIHELVHVRQYRNMGKEVFVNKYLSEALIKGYANISTEKEAKRFENWVGTILNTHQGCVYDLASIQGKISYLRIHPPETMYGTPPNQLDAEIIIKLDSNPEIALGFNLRSADQDVFASEMFELALSAFGENHNVKIEYLKSGTHIGKVLRIINAK